MKTMVDTQGRCGLRDFFVLSRSADQKRVLI